MIRQLFLLMFIGLVSTTNSYADSWVQLFNSTDLAGWKVLNGKADFYVKDKIIVGKSVSGQPNSFLCTEKDYDNFILEFEMMIEDGLNSGIQIRSQSKTDYKNYRVHGYQVECDTSNRAWSGGIYDEARRGWLYPLEINPKAQKAFHLGKWNEFRIEALGTRIRTFINGILCADLIDDITPSGFIGLQVHSIGNNKQLEGKKVYWKKLRIMTNPSINDMYKEDTSVPQVNLIPNTLSPKEKTQGWKLLWDGKTTNGWKSTEQDRFPSKGWEINNGELIVTGKGGGDIVTVNKFTNFELQLDFKLTKGANSGIKYFVDPAQYKDNSSWVGCEYQILDDSQHPDAKEGVNGNRTLASLYDLIPAHNEYGKRVNEYGWNTAKIVVNGVNVQHWLNNIKMVDYHRRNQMWKALVQNSKYKKYAGFGNADSGHILIQNHGDKVHFRSIKIRQLNEGQ